MATRTHIRKSFRIVRFIGFVLSDFEPGTGAVPLLASVVAQPMHPMWKHPISQSGL
jgi:hypothetical protein